MGRLRFTERIFDKILQEGYNIQASKVTPYEKFYILFVNPHLLYFEKHKLQPGGISSC